MNWTLERSHEAQADLIDIWCYIAVDLPHSAGEMIGTIMEMAVAAMKAHLDVGNE